MTDQQELDFLLDAFFVDGTDELPDRVIDAALDEIDHTQQRHALRLPRRILTMNVPIRVAAAAAIGVLAVGGALILTRPSQSTIGGPSPTPEVSSRSTQPAGPSANPSATAVAPSVVPPRAATWTATGNMIQGRTFGTATLLPDGKVLVLGDEERGTAELYDPASRTWSATKRMVKARFFGSTATLLPDGRVLVAGGGNAPASAPASAELYDPASGSWTPTGTKTTRRVGHTATLQQDGRVLVAGGDNFNGGAVSSAELYDPSSGSWTPTGSMAEARSEYAATLLPDGKVLVAGGLGPRAANTVLASSELYDPASGSWTATGDMAEPRAGVKVTLLPDGKVLVAGGGGNAGGNAGSGFHPTADLYNPGNGTWTATGAMIEGRGQYTATLLPDGKVLVAGGDNGNFLASAELYDPVSGSWTATTSMATPRAAHTATLLQDGKVLVASGYHGGDALATAELYDPGTGN
jgi:WD40 repeat protein